MKILAIAASVAVLGVAGWSMSARPDVSSPKPVVARPSPPPAPEKPKARRIDDVEAERLFRLVLRGIREEYVYALNRPGCGWIGPWLGQDLQHRGPQARTFAKAYPDLARRLVLEILEDPEAPSPDRDFALTVLSCLDGWTTPRLEELLLGIVSPESEYGSYFAVGLLGRRDPELRHRKVYEDECRRGNSVAFHVLSCVDDPRSVAFFKELARQPQPQYYPVAQIPDHCEKALRRLAVLRSAGWQKAVEKILRAPLEDRYDDMEELSWALGVARLRYLPSTLACLEERLKTAPEEYGGLKTCRDQLLATYVELGGRLDLADAARLRPNGFVGDPEERFLEIVRELRHR